MDTDIFVVLQGEYEPTIAGYIVGEEVAKKYCSQFNLELEEKVNNGELDEKGLRYSKTHDITSCFPIGQILPNIKDKYNFYKEYLIEFSESEEGAKKYTPIGNFTYEVYISENVKPNSVAPNADYSNIQIFLTADSDENAMTIALNLLANEIDSWKSREIVDKITVQETLANVNDDIEGVSADSSEDNEDLANFAKAIASANADMTLEEIEKKVKSCTWALIADIDYEDSSAKIYRTNELNSVVNCIVLEDLDTTDGEKFKVYTNPYGEKSIYLANNKLKALTVDYADMIIDSKDGVVFSPLTVMQAINEEIGSDIEDGTTYEADVLELLRIKMVALTPDATITMEN